MDIEASSAVRLFFPNSSLLMVFFEAIANAFDANADTISVKIEISSFDKPSSLVISVIDNGKGFNDENFDRFKTLLRPRDDFHKGLGRLLFLEYFNQVEIDSYWENMQRHFVFNNNFDGIAHPEERKEKSGSGSTLVFKGFLGEKIHSYDYLKPEALKKELVVHFLPLLLNLKKQSTRFKISIDLQTDENNRQKDFFSTEETISIVDLPEMEEQKVSDTTIDFLNTMTVLYHIRKSEGREKNLIAFNVDGRTIAEKLVAEKSIPTGYWVVFIFESELFKIKSDTSRQKLIMPDGIDKDNVYETLRREIGNILARKISQIGERNKNTKQRLEDNFPHLYGYFEEATAGLIEHDDSLNSAQKKFLKDQKSVLQSEKLTDATFEKSLELSSRTLTQYIVYRDKVIQRMRAITDKDSEAVIHNLIVPKQKQFSQGEDNFNIYHNNAWLLDDKFMSFRTILSDRRMEEVISAIRLDDERSKESGRPDIAMIFSADPDVESAVDVVIVEIKKKTNDEKENLYAVNQLLDRATKLAKHCTNIQRIWYYAVIQIDESLEVRLRQTKYAPLFSKGKVYYQEFPTLKPDGCEVPTPLFLLSFDAIVDDAEARNHTFFQILRDGIRKFSEKSEN